MHVANKKTLRQMGGPGLPDYYGYQTIDFKNEFLDEIHALAIRIMSSK
jgi:hypothetical protein